MQKFFLLLPLGVTLNLNTKCESMLLEEAKFKIWEARRDASKTSSTVELIPHQSPDVCDWCYIFMSE